MPLYFEIGNEWATRREVAPPQKTKGFAVAKVVEGLLILTLICGGM